MNAKELLKWASHHSTLFPDWGLWWRERMATCAGAWSSVLADVSLDEATHVSNQMARGRIEPIAKHSYDHTTATIMRHVDADRAKNRVIRERTREVETIETRKRDTSPTLGSLREHVARIARGEDRDAVLEEVGGHESHYRCLTCQDTGLVEVYHRRVVQERMEGTLARHKPPRVMACRCTCSSGKRFGQGDKQRPGPATYDRKQHCRIIAPATVPHDWTQLDAWCDEMSRVESHANYRSEFDTWNGG